MLVNFFLKLVYSTMVEKKFQIYGIHIPRKCDESRHFYSCPTPQSKLSPKFLSSPPLPQAELNYAFPQAAFFQKSVPPQQQKGWRKLWFALSKFYQKIWRWLGTLGYLCFVWLAIFSNMMVLQFWKNIFIISHGFTFIVCLLRPR